MRLLRASSGCAPRSRTCRSRSAARCGLEYSGRRPFAQRRNTASPRFGALLWEIGRWLRTARRSLDERDYEQHSLGRYLDERGYSRRFRRHFLVPLTSALWSTAPGRALEFPAAYAIRFFDNHGMLGLPPLRAGERSAAAADTYVRALSDRLGPRLHLGLGARSLAARRGRRRADDRRRRAAPLRRGRRRDARGSGARAARGSERRRASRCSAPSATPATTPCSTPTERLLPRARPARAAWNYRLGDDGRPTVTYSLNRLQALAGETEYCVTLNERGRGRARDPPPRLRASALHRRARSRAQRELPSLSGRRHVYYAGAHHGNGFHEDGLASGVRVGGRAGGELVRSALYLGSLTHSRRAPATNVFRYPLSTWLLDLDELPELERRLKLLSVNGRNVVSFHDRDHFDGDRPLKAGGARLRGRPRDRAGARADPARGCSASSSTRSASTGATARDGSLACMVAELNNTFGERPPRAPPRRRARLRARQAPPRLPVLRPRRAPTSTPSRSRASRSARGSTSTRAGRDRSPPSSTAAGAS